MSDAQTMRRPVQAPNIAIAELWLDHDEPRVKAMLEGLQNLLQRRWVCACGELVEGGFEECWQCGLPMQVLCNASRVLRLND